MPGPFPQDGQSYYGDEDLLSMGRAAGYIPAEPEVEAGIPNTEMSTMQGGLTQPDYLPETLTTVTQPGATDQIPQLSSGFGVGYGQTSFSGNTFDRTEQKAKGLYGAYQEADQKAQASGANMAGVAGMAHDSAVDAEAQKAKAEAARIHAQGREALVMQRLQDDFAVEEAKINAESQATANQAKMDYLAALHDFRGAKVDPQQFWKGMNGGTQFGMLASAFVHDFLGAKGINTSAMSTFNRAVDQNIDAQIQAIKNKGEVAEGFKSLWWMQRNQSASDTEARTRVRGFLLEGAKQKIIANMAQYESALASAQGQAAIAKIDEELAKTLIEVYKHTDQNALALRNQALQKWEAQLRASIDQQNVNLRAQELAQKQLEAKGGKNPFANYLADTSVSGGGKLRWEIIAGTPAQQDEIRQKFGHQGAVDQEVLELQSMMAKVGSLPSDKIPAFLQSQEGAALLAKRDRLAYNLAYLKSGMNMRESEVEHFKRQFPIDTWLTRGDRDKIIADTANGEKRLIFGAYAPFLREVGENEAIEVEPGKSVKLRDIPMSPYFNRPGEMPSGVPGAGAYQNNLSIITPAEPDMADHLRRQAGEFLAPAVKDAELTGEDKTADVVEAKGKFIKQNPQYAEGATRLDQDPNAKSDIVRNSDKALVDLARLAAAGGTSGKQAYDMLKNRASSYLNQGNKDDEEGAFAAYLMTELESAYGEVSTGYSTEAPQPTVR